MYLSYYNLKEEPFQLTPNPRFVYLAEAHRKVLFALLNAVVYRRGLVLVTGPVGAGKTTLLHTALHILERKFKNRLVSAFLVNPCLTRDEFLETLLEEFEVFSSSPTKPSRLAALRRLFLETQRSGGTTVLVVDEAHLLSIEILEEIRLLSNADTYEGKPLQIVLSGQPELVSMLEHSAFAALRQRIAVRTMLQPLTALETAQYIRERLHVSGLRGDLPFSAPSLDRIHSLSNGVPRLISLLCDHCLSIGYERSRRQITPDIVTDAAGLLALSDRQADSCPEPPVLVTPLTQGATQ